MQILFRNIRETKQLGIELGLPDDIYLQFIKEESYRACLRFNLHVCFFFGVVFKC